MQKKLPKKGGGDSSVLLSSQNEVFNTEIGLYLTEFLAKEIPWQYPNILGYFQGYDIS